uniref:Uncharacterized protein n=1 Tax=Rhizophora mucronata TaxID=61149 RepID=A0A2P2PFI4_RHIMU
MIPTLNAICFPVDHSCLAFNSICYLPLIFG